MMLFKNYDPIICKVYRHDGEIYKLVVKNHTKVSICMVVSMFTINLVNSIDYLTDVHFIDSYDEKAGFISIEFPEVKKGNINNDVKLLLESYLVGIRSLRVEYPKYIKVFDKGGFVNVKA